MGESKRDVVLQLVTFEQANRLKEAGFDLFTERAYNGMELLGCIITSATDSMGGDYYHGARLVRAPAVALALKWCRDVKGAACAVYPAMNCDDSISYIGKFLGLLDGFDQPMLLNTDTHDRDTYEVAESALLDAVLDFLGNGSFDA